MGEPLHWLGNDVVARTKLETWTMNGVPTPVPGPGFGTSLPAAMLLAAMLLAAMLIRKLVDVFTDPSMMHAL